jgi:hypothetical protein
LKEQAASANVSNGDYVEMLIRERAGQSPLRLPTSAKLTGPKGGAKSFFFGKNRGTTTAVCVTPMAHRLLDEQVAASRMSRGDYIEFLLRDKAGLLDEHLKVAMMASQNQPFDASPAPIAQPQQPTPVAQPMANPVINPVVNTPETENTAPAAPTPPITTSWSSGF